MVRNDGMEGMIGKRKPACVRLDKTFARLGRRRFQVDTYDGGAWTVTQREATGESAEIEHTRSGWEVTQNFNHAESAVLASGIVKQSLYRPCQCLPAEF
jgi:hypothetical protein